MKNEIFDNHMNMEFDAKSQNESLARVAVAAFLTETDPTVEEMNDIKTAVSEAVTNSIIHGYDEGEGKIYLKCRLIRKIFEKSEDTYNEDNIIKIEIKDEGVGIEDIEQARQPLYTTKPELERSGMGFLFMEMFMDKIDVQSNPGIGTVVTMEKKLKKTRKRTA